ncbi:hypothetical protein Tco_1374982 [Tanacetum coccineum]
MVKKASPDKATALPAEGEKDDDTNLKNELVDLLGIDSVTRYYNNKLLYEKYCEKLKKRRQSSKIINCDVLTKKGLVLLKVYREDGIAKVIQNFKVSDLQQAEWRELHIDFNKSLQEQDPLDELNDLANKKRKRTSDSTDHSRLKFKFEGDNTPIVIQPPCYSASKPTLQMKWQLSGEATNSSHSFNPSSRQLGSTQLVNSADSSRGSLVLPSHPTP